MAKEFLGETALARLIELTKKEFDKYPKRKEMEQHLEEALEGKLDKMSDAGGERAYGIGTKGEQQVFPLSRYAMTNTIAYRTTDGALRVGRAIDNACAVPLAQMNEALDARLGSLDAALDRVLELQAFYTGETFDELHEYAEGVIAGGES